ncbi:hypothetical protein WBP06_23920 [Novosphingobium sp. BL-8H]|uniref:hypothetical protein n=1 Tax=Novosphingobium sp. BL-8H TaxID=3127640 RepID=UPI0037567725
MSDRFVQGDGAPVPACLPPQWNVDSLVISSQSARTQVATRSQTAGDLAEIADAKADRITSQHKFFREWECDHFADLGWWRHTGFKQEGLEELPGRRRAVRRISPAMQARMSGVSVVFGVRTMF